MRRPLALLLLLALARPLGAAGTPGSASPELEAPFAHPPPQAQPWIYWYWMYGAVSRQGIAADLAAMKADGLRGALLVAIKGPADHAPLGGPAVVQLTPQWWDLIRYAFAEADRQGLKLALHSSDGFSIAGGPWITPADSMQRVVWSETQASGGAPVSATLAQPPAVRGYYRDIAVVAFPSLPGAASLPPPAVTTSIPGRTDGTALSQPGNQAEFAAEKPAWIQYAYPRPVTVRTVTIRTPPWVGYQANRLGMEASDDGVHFRPLPPLVSARHGWEDNDEPNTHAIPAATARYFRFLYDPAGSEAGSEDLDSAKFGTKLRILGIALGGEPRIDAYEGKNAAMWRIAAPTPAATLPDRDCVSPARMVDLTARLRPGGRLDWTPPPGEWTILRLGHTSTGHENDTGGGGRGLECDKLSARTAQIQFDHWFGEAVRQIGPDLAKRVLDSFYMDSWECGSQNWTDDFPAEFRRRRGYELAPYLPALAGIPVGSAERTERFLRDVRATVDDLLQERFLGTLARLAHERGFAFRSECVAPVMESDDLRHYRDTDVPMGEFWLRSASHDKPNDILDAVSGAHSYGHPIAEAEAFTELRNQWDERPEMLKPLADLNFCRGINRLVFHVMAENPWPERKPGMTLNGVGTFFSANQTWWRPGRAWFDYVARCQAMLQAGRPVADVAVFSGEELPRRAVLADQLTGVLPALADPAEDAADPLRGYAYDTINPDVLLHRARVRNGRIVLPGGASYAVLVVPGARRMNPDGAAMSPEVAAKLAAMARAGADILWQTAPTHSPGLAGYPGCDAAVRAAAASVWPVGDRSRRFESGGEVSAVPAAIPGAPLLGVPPDFVARDPDGRRLADVAWTHRSAEGWDFYFVSNQVDRPRTLMLSLRDGAGPGRAIELWDPVTGERRPAAAEPPASEGPRRPSDVAVRLAAHGSVFVVFRSSGEAVPGPRGDYNWHLPVSIQQIGPAWDVAFDPAAGGPEQPVHFPALADWTSRPEPGIKYYSGTARYTCHFKWDPSAAKGPIWLELGKVESLAEVSLNGHPCGVAWTPPFRLEVTSALRPGDNELAIDVTNTWANRLVGDAALPPAQRRTWTIAPSPAALLPAGLLGPVTLSAENPAPVARGEMERVYRQVQTPYKYGIVLKPAPGGLVDCPSVYRYRGAWYMLYVANQGKVGYETYLARSGDLLHWTPLGKVLPFSGAGWDRWQGDGGAALVDPRWGGSAELERYDGKYWMTYIGGALQGYETDPLSVGVAWTDEPGRARPWNRIPENPVLSPTDPTARAFERKTLYKSQVIRDPDASLGYPFVMFYNGKEGGYHAWTERIGMALSRDMRHWTRYGAGPVLDNGYGISGDPQIVRMDGLWVMFYFGAFWRPGAFDTFACSRDLAHWTPWEGPSLISSSRPWDATFAHKPWLIQWRGVVYHFYCAVGDQGRAIALATSRPMGSAAPPPSYR